MATSTINNSIPVTTSIQTSLDKLEEVRAYYKRVKNMSALLRNTLSSLTVPNHAGSAYQNQSRLEKGKEEYEELKKLIQAFDDYEDNIKELVADKDSKFEDKFAKEFAFILKEEDVAKMRKAIFEKEKIEFKQVESISKCIAIISDEVSESLKEVAKAVFPMLAGIPSVPSQENDSAENQVGTFETLTTQALGILQAHIQKHETILEEINNTSREIKSLATTTYENGRRVQAESVRHYNAGERLNDIISSLSRMVYLAEEEISERHSFDNDANEVIKIKQQAIELLDKLESLREVFIAVFVDIEIQSKTIIEDKLAEIIRLYEKSNERLYVVKEYWLNKHLGGHTGYHANLRDKTINKTQSDEYFINRKIIIKKIIDSNDTYKIFNGSDDANDNMKILIDISKELKEVMNTCRGFYYNHSDDERNSKTLAHIYESIKEKVIKHLNLPSNFRPENQDTDPRIVNQTLLLMGDCKKIFPACKDIDDAKLADWISAKRSSLLLMDQKKPSYQPGFFHEPPRTSESKNKPEENGYSNSPINP